MVERLEEECSLKEESQKVEEDGLVISADKGKRKATKLRKQSREKKKRQVCNSLFKSKEQMALIKANIPDLDCIRSDPYDLVQPI